MKSLFCKPRPGERKGNPGKPGGQQTAANGTFVLAHNFQARIKQTSMPLANRNSSYAWNKDFLSGRECENVYVWERKGCLLFVCRSSISFDTLLVFGKLSSAVSEVLTSWLPAFTCSHGNQSCSVLIPFCGRFFFFTRAGISLPYEVIYIPRFPLIPIWNFTGLFAGQSSHYNVFCEFGRVQTSMFSSSERLTIRCQWFSLCSPRLSCTWRKRARAQLSPSDSCLLSTRGVGLTSLSPWPSGCRCLL